MYETDAITIKKEKAVHPVITKDFPENLHGGIMVCGINFGYSLKDEDLEQSGTPREMDAASFFSDRSVNNTRFRNTALKWLASWGLPFSYVPGDEKAFDQSFFQTNWLNTQTRSVQSDEKITVGMMVNEADSILKLIEERKPSVILFFGGQMIEALNDISIRARVISALGERSGNAEIHRANLADHKGTQFKMLTQTFGETLIVSLPHPQTIGITDEYMAALKPTPQQIAKIITPPSNAAKIQNTGANDPVFESAIAALPVGESLPVSFLQRKFRLGYQRAILLHEAIKAAREADPC